MEDEDLTAEQWKHAAMMYKKESEQFARENGRLENKCNILLNQLALLNMPKEKGKKGRRGLRDISAYPFYLWREAHQIRCESIGENLRTGSKIITERNAALLAHKRIMPDIKKLHEAGMPGGFVHKAPNYPASNATIISAYNAEKKKQMPSIAKVRS